MIYNEHLQKNNTELRGILDSVNVLPDVGNGGNGLDYFKYMNNVQALFEGTDFPEGTKIVMRLENLRNPSISTMFYNVTGVDEVKIIANVDRVFSCTSAFRSKSLKVVDIEEFDFYIGAGSMMFYFAENLNVIKGELNFQNATGLANTFYNCTSLEEIRIKPLTLSLNVSFLQSPLLSAESIQSIINGLADLTGQITQTITFHATVKAKLTEEQIATITGKNWTLA